MGRPQHGQHRNLCAEARPRVPGHCGRAVLVHALCRPVLGSLPAELGVLVPVERDCLSASLSGRDLLPVLRSSWMARVVAHCVVLSALDEHWMVRGYLLCVMLVFWRARGVSLPQMLQRGTCAR